MPSRKKQTSGAGETSASGRKKKTTPAKPSGVSRSPAARKKAAPTTAPGLPPGDRGHDLVIVESPAKAKTIGKYLGPGYRVMASYGHVRDLPKRAQKGEEVAGVRIAGGWQARYVLADKDSGGAGGKGFARRSAKDILDELKREADRANRVFLATDPDREGEAIAWHIEDALGLEDARTFRITFNEITKSAVQQALAHPTHINRERVKAQEARRILDRVVGYPLSGLLGKKVVRGLSAGRVQSVATRLVVEREREIEAFKTEEYWRIHALLAPQGAVTGYTADPAKAKVFAKKKGAAAEKPEPEPEKAEAAEDGKSRAKEEPGLPKPPPGAFLAELARWDGKDVHSPADARPDRGRVVRTEAEADEILAALRSQTFVVTRIEQKDRAEKPHAPFTTSTLQQQANIRLHYSANHTMRLAQQLYEGVELGAEGSVALITYMRTDSTRVSDDALRAVRGHIEHHYGKKYLPERPHTYASGKSAQEAHEAIRPTDLSYTPDRVRPYLSNDQHRLYTLIYNRFVASQMAPAIFAVTNVEVTAGPGLFKAQGKIEKFDGYRRVLPPAGRQEDVILPPLAEKQVLDRLDLFAGQHFTQPPPRYNEASLVKALEKEGIGRPSTYANIITVIQKRGYVEQKERRFYATEMGKLVTDLLVKHFPKVMDVKFTGRMEDDLDSIETGKTHYEEVLNEFWGPFSESLRRAEEEMPRQKGTETGEACPWCGRPLVRQFSMKTGKPFVGCSGWADKENPCKYIQPAEGEEARPRPVLTEHKCPKCGKPLARREGKKGPFYGCSGFPECKVIMNIGPGGEPVPAVQETEYTCDKCGKPMVLREGRKGPFFACSGFPKCRNAQDVGPDGRPVRPAETGVTCDKCGQPMVVKQGRFGKPFLSCSAYPKCRNAKPLPDELKEKLKDQLPAAPERKKAPDIEVSETCPECGGPMAVRRSARGPFLGCKKYPKCKGTREAPPEVVQKLQEAGA